MDPGKLIKSSSLYLIGSIASRAVSFLMIPLYTRFLTPSDYATIELADLMISFIVITFGCSAITGSMIRIYHDWKDFENRSTVVSSALLTSVVFDAVVLGSAALFAPQLSLLLFRSPVYASFIRFCLLASYFGNVVELCLSYHRLVNRALFFVFFCLVQLFCVVLLNFYLLAVERSGIWSFVVSRLLVNGVGAALLVFLVLGTVGVRWRSEPVRRMLSFGAPLILTAASFFVIHFSDRFFLTRYETMGNLGVYSLAYRFGFLITFLVGQPFGRAWNVSLYEYVDQSGWKENFARVTRFFVFCLATVGVGIALFCDEALKVMAGRSFHGAALMVPIIVAAYVCRDAGDYFRQMVYIFKERSLRVGLLTAGCAAVNLALNFILIPRAGVMGAAWATLGTWFAYLVIIWRAAHRDHRLPYSVRSFAGLCVLAVAVWYAGRFVSALPATLQWPADALLLVVFCLTAYLCGYFPRQDRETIARTLAGLLKRIGPSRQRAEVH